MRLAKPEFGIYTEAKWAFTTRRVPFADACQVDDEISGACPGDLVLGRVERLGSHRGLQLRDARRSQLYVGDIIVAVCGARYASDQFEGGAEISEDGADLLAAGGVIGHVRRKHERMSSPTRIAPLGLLAGENGQRLNLVDYALPTKKLAAHPTTICVVGSGMNSGKTTTLASLINGLTRAGLKAAAIKLTGTGACGDYNAYVDAGAWYVADFTDTGMVSTYGVPVEEILRSFTTLLAHSSDNGADVVLVEIADGILQEETAALLGNPGFVGYCDGFVFTAHDPLAAIGGLSKLSAKDLEPVALSGVFTRSPLSIKEVLDAYGGASIRTNDEFCDPSSASSLLMQIAAQRGMTGRDASLAVKDNVV